MGSVNLGLMIALLGAVAIAACVVIFVRRRQPRSAAKEASRKASEEEQHQKAEQDSMPMAEEDDRQRLEVECHRLEEEQERTEGERDKAEEKREGLVEEAQAATEELRKAEEEQERRESDLVQSKTQPLQVVEDQKRLEEEILRKRREGRQKAEQKEHLKGDSEPKERLEPIKRGGRPRTGKEHSEEQAGKETRPRHPKPEIVCWRRERQWVLAVELPEDLLDLRSLEVLQNASPLSQDEYKEDCWRLEQVCGEVVVRYSETEVSTEIKVAVGENDCLLFKLSGQNQNEGRRVKTPSSGSYLLVVPENWERHNALSERPPESVCLTGYQAHFLILEKDDGGKISFRTPAGESFVIESKASRFELVGARLNDANEDMGHLFGKGPPRIRALYDQAWKDVGTIILGEAGSGKVRWRRQFNPVPGEMEQNLPSELATRKGGWYFLWFYDTNYDLIESMDFRFVVGLNDIKVHQPPPLPSERGHATVSVELFHESDCIFQPARSLERRMQTEHKDDATVLFIPPEPTYDITRWLVGTHDGPQVEVTIVVERIWLAVGEEDDAPSKWEGKPVTLLADYFTATSKKALWLRLPRCRWAHRILAGFEESEARSYPVRVTERMIAIPLREFSDCHQMSARDEDHCLSVWIHIDDKVIEGIVAIIPALQRPMLCYARGRKRTAVATAVLRSGTGTIKVNEQPVEKYFRKTPFKARMFLWRLLQLPNISQKLSQMEVSISVKGSSPSTVQQVKASAHALARALMRYDPRLKPLLRQAGFGGTRITTRANTQAGS